MKWGLYALCGFAGLFVAAMGAVAGLMYFYDEEVTDEFYFMSESEYLVRIPIFEDPFYYGINEAWASPASWAFL